MRTTFSNLAILASSLLVKGAFAAPIQERALYLDTDVVMVTEEITVSEMPDGSYATGVAVAVGTATIDGTPVLYTESATASPLATSSTSQVPATTSSVPVIAASSSTGAVFIQQSKTSAAVVKSSTSAAPIPSTTSTSTSAAPIIQAPVTTSSVAPIVTLRTSTTPVAVSSTTSSKAVTSSTVSSSSGKRGVAYNSASLVSAFSSASEVTWAYNWGSTTSTIASGIEYIPMLWGLSSGDTSSWSSVATKAIAAGSTALLGFNEPDYSGQANLGTTAAAKGWTTYMQPFAGKATLVSPAVTNGGTPMGLTWLEGFISACSSCTIDAIAIHWYNGGTAQDFKDYVAKAYTAGGNRPLWITEFQASGSADDQAAFLKIVLPWLDASNMVAKYAYFMASDGNLISGTSLSALGTTFATFV